MKKILSDHKKIGKKFIPPFLYKLGNIKLMHWKDIFLPELIWIALMHEKLGLRRAIEVTGKICEASITLWGEETQDRPLLILISNFYALSESDTQKLILAFDKFNILIDINYSIEDLIYLYPKCPLKNILISKEVNINHKEKVDYFKKILNKYFIRGNKESNLLEATTLSMLWNSGKFKYTNGVKPPNLNILIEKQSKDEEYEKVASSVRASIQSLGLMLWDKDSEWPSYFWNRGLELDECEK